MKNSPLIPFITINHMPNILPDPLFATQKWWGKLQTTKLFQSTVQSWKWKEAGKTFRKAPIAFWKIIFWGWELCKKWTQRYFSQAIKLQNTWKVQNCAKFIFCQNRPNQVFICWGHFKLSCAPWKMARHKRPPFKLCIYISTLLPNLWQDFMQFSAIFSREMKVAEWTVVEETKAPKVSEKCVCFFTWPLFKKVEIQSFRLISWCEFQTCDAQIKLAQSDQLCDKNRVSHSPAAPSSFELFHAHQAK